jgi:hypothetical protein
MIIADRESLMAMQPHLVADLTVNDNAEGPFRTAVLSYQCICSASREFAEAYSAQLQLVKDLTPGGQQRVGFLFLVPVGAEVMRRAGKFFWWQGKAAGEATVVQS